MQAQIDGLERNELSQKDHIFDDASYLLFGLAQGMFYFFQVYNKVILLSEIGLQDNFVRRSSTSAVHLINFPWVGALPG